MRKIVVGVAVLLLSAAALIFWRLEDHDLSGRTSAPLSFTANGNRLSGTVWLPEGEPIAAVVLVHGDGPQDRTSDGAYATGYAAFMAKDPMYRIENARAAVRVEGMGANGALAMWEPCAVLRAAGRPVDCCFTHRVTIYCKSRRSE